MQLSKSKENANSKKEKGRNFIDKQAPLWLLWGLGVSLAASIIFTCFYGVFRREASQKTPSYPLETADNLRWLYHSCYLLYRDLYLNQNPSADWTEIYLKRKGVEDTEDARQPEEQPSEEADSETERVYAEAKEQLNFYLSRIDSCFTELNTNYNYLAEDLENGTFLSNFIAAETYHTQTYENFLNASQYFALSFVFDENGIVQIGNQILGKEPDTIRKTASEIIHSYKLTNYIFPYADNPYGSAADFEISNPKNCRITYFISHADLQKMLEKGSFACFDEWGIYPAYLEREIIFAYKDTNIAMILSLLGILIVIGAVFLPVLPLGKQRIFGQFVPAPEGLFVLYGIAYFLGDRAITSLVIFMCGDMTTNKLPMILQPELRQEYAVLLRYEFNIVLLMIYFFGIWCLGLFTREIRNSGIRDYLCRHSLILRFLRYLKAGIWKEYEQLIKVDITEKAGKKIRKILLINAFFLCIISLCWIGGIVLTVIYSVFLYVLLKRRVSRRQKEYALLLGSVSALAEGKLEVTIEEDIGIFEPFRPELQKVREGIQKAVAEQTKSQRMKTELVTNMSHDLKTPLTAIITYVNLLKEEDVTEEKRKEYLDILEKKSMRMKVLIEDLFEVSKANSQDVRLEFAEVDIVNLLKQAAFEIEDKFAEAGLELRMKLPEEKIILSLDSQKTYRVYENLFANIAKYALTGTRVYVDAFLNEDSVVVTLKNIAAEELTITPEELTERFVRGDHSRHTEGSGLGLAIAKSFMELQGGRLLLELDGDLFKVTTVFPLKPSGPKEE